MAAACLMTIVSVSILCTDASFTDWNTVKSELVVSGFPASRLLLSSDDTFEKVIKVKNGMCKGLEPGLVARPINAAEVAMCVVAAREFNFSISVRSGGHSYICQSSKSNSLHLDLRKLNKIEQVEIDGQVGSNQQVYCHQ